MTADPFSDILRLANARSVVSGGFTAGGSWAIRFPAFDKLKFSALIRGSGWLVIDGDEEAVRVEAGDVFLLSAQRSFVLASDLAAVPIEAASVFSPHVSEVVKLGGGEECLQIGGFVELDPASGGLLADVLPPLIHVRAASPHAKVLRWLLDQLVHEQAAERAGASLVSAQLAQLIFIQILRAHLESGDLAAGSAAGWLRALGDQRIAPALRLMHSDPARSWQLEELARATAMSRTTFVVRFTTADLPAELAHAPGRTRLANRERPGFSPRALTWVHVRERFQQCLQADHGSGSEEVQRNGAARWLASRRWLQRSAPPARIPV
jgi:hypothetical protein